MIDVALFLVYTTVSVVGMMLIKFWLPPAKTAWESGTGFGGPGLLVMLGAGLYILSFLIWIVILSRSQLSVAFPTAIGLTLVFSTIGAVTVLNEPVAAPRLVGIVLILTGIFFVARS